MPKELTHWTLAERALFELDDDSPLEKIIREHKHLFLIGAVLPDTPFYVISDPFARELRILGNGIHDTGENSYKPVARVFDTYRDNLPPGVIALMAGVLSHLCADIAFHPFVYYFCGGRNLVRHFRMESYIDLYFLEQENGPPLRYFRDLYPGFYHKGEMDHQRFIDVLRCFFQASPELPDTSLEKTLRVHARFQRQFDRRFVGWLVRVIGLLPGVRTREMAGLFYPPLKKPFCRKHPPLFPGDYRYRHPITGENHCRSLDQLADETVNDTVKLFRLMEAHLDHPCKLSEELSRLEGPNLLTGLPGEKKENMTRFDTGYDLRCLVFGGYNL